MAHVIGDDAHETTRFSEIRGLSINAVGDVFVLDDSRTPDIRMFNAKGAFVKRVAREGHGPGELSGPNGMIAIPAGGFAVNDVGNGRITIWSDSVTYLRQLPLTSSLREWVWRSGFDTQRRLIEIALVPLPSVPASERVASLRRIPLDGKLSDVVPLPDCRPAGPKPVASFTGARGAGPGMMVPFSAVQRRAIDTQGYLWCSPGGEYRIERYRIGSPEKPLVLTRTNALEQVPKASYDSAIAVVNAFKARWVGGNTDPTLVPRNFPAIEGLAVDNKSRLWVKRPSRGNSLTRFDVWEGGRMIATVESPLRLAREMPVWIVGETLYGIGVDDDGVQSVLVATIVH